MPDQVGSLTITDPAKLKVVADPFRQRLLSAFKEPTTTKQVAEKLSIEGNKIYHHVDQLLEAGFLFVVSTEQKRGTIERTFQASALRFIAALGEEYKHEDLFRESFDVVLTCIHDVSNPQFQPRLIRTNMRLSESGWQDFEDALTDLIREYEDPNGPAIGLQITAYEVPDSTA